MAAWIARQRMLLNPGKKPEEAKVPGASAAAQPASQAPAEKEQAGKPV
jgi:hypothetical protein